MHAGSSPGQSRPLPVPVPMGSPADGPRALTGSLCLTVMVFDTPAPRVVPQPSWPEREHYRPSWTAATAAGQNHKRLRTQQRLHEQA